MQKFIYDIEEAKNNFAEKKAKEYINKYLKELQRHFDLSDRKMRIILYKIYKESGFLHKISKFMKNGYSVLKSKYKKFSEE